MFRRITKRQAMKLFAEGKGVYLCPCKMRPGFPWNPAMEIYGKEWFEQAEAIRPTDLVSMNRHWLGSVPDTAWELMMTNWLFYNASYEGGYYPHYYVIEE